MESRKETTALIGSRVNLRQAPLHLSQLLTRLADFQVTEPLPGVDFALPNNYAGNIAVQREGHPNDTLFFWAFEHNAGSLTAATGQNSDTPWAIWLNGG